jgi:hypothetical protein
VVNYEHNHPPSGNIAAHPILRREAREALNLSSYDALLEAGTPVKTVLSSIQRANGRRLLEITAKDLYNRCQKLLKLRLRTRTPIQALLANLEAAGMHPRWRLDKKGHVKQLFFLHPEALQLYKQYPDVLLMDCTYKTNKFRMPLLNIVFPIGLHTTIQLGLCFMRKEKEKHYR